MPEDPYVYPGTSVLRNHDGVRDAQLLAQREHDASNLRLLQLQGNPLPGRYDLAHLQALHRHIFGDIYPWAGEIRTVALAKGDLFALPQHIKPYLSSILDQLPAEDYLRDMPREQLAHRLAYYLAEINSVHPFREGNGRAQRAFVGQLAYQADHFIAWDRLDPQRNIDASRQAHHGNEQPLRAVLDQLTEPLTAHHAAQEIKRLMAASCPQPLSAALKPGQQHTSARPAASHATRPARNPRRSP